jgi:hypothetical protein
MIITSYPANFSSGSQNPPEFEPVQQLFKGDLATIVYRQAEETPDAVSGHGHIIILLSGPKGFVFGSISSNNIFTPIPRPQENP